MGFALKVEGDQGGGDDTAVNGITMTCSGGEFLHSHYSQKNY